MNFLAFPPSLFTFLSTFLLSVILFFFLYHFHFFSLSFSLLSSPSICSFTYIHVYPLSFLPFVLDFPSLVFYSISFPSHCLIMACFFSLAFPSIFFYLSHSFIHSFILSFFHPLGPSWDEAPFISFLSLPLFPSFFNTCHSFFLTSPAILILPCLSLIFHSICVHFTYFPSQLSLAISPTLFFLFFSAPLTLL